MRCAVRIAVDRGRLGGDMRRFLSLCRGAWWGGRVVLGVSGAVVPWGLVGSVCVWLCLTLPCRVKWCRVISCR